MKLSSIVLLVFTQTILAALVASESARLIVVRQPSHHVYDYSSKSELKISDLNSVLLAANGFSIEKTPEWKGLKTTNPLSIPKATLLFLVDSKNLNDSFSKQYIPVQEDVHVDVNSLITRLGSSVVAKTFDGLNNDLKSLEDDCSGALSTVFYVFRVSESDSSELQKSIDDVIEKFNKQCVADASNDLLVYVLATEEKHRSKRQAVAANTNNIINPAVFYSDQYPAMFNLLFWTTLLLALAVYGVAYGMYRMDPGLDTVIYRMTSQRIKKDQ